MLVDFTICVDIRNVVFLERSLQKAFLQFPRETDLILLGFEGVFWKVSGQRPHTIEKFLILKKD